MSAPTVLDSERLPDGSGWVLQKGIDSYRYYFFGPGELDDEYREMYEVRWVDFDLDEDLGERFFLDATDLQEIADALGIDAGELSRDVRSRKPEDRARAIREYINFYGDDAVDDEPEIFEYTDMVREFPYLFRGSGTNTGRDVTDELAQINAHRRSLGMAPLDPASAGWSDEDVVIEARRLRSNPRDQMLDWYAG